MTPVLSVVGRLVDVWAASPGWEQVSELGLPALGLIVGAGAYHWFVAKPERERLCRELELERARGTAAAAKEEARADQEREDRQESEARERKGYELALPALQEASRTMETVMRWVNRQGPA